MMENDGETHTIHENRPSKPAASADEVEKSNGIDSLKQDSVYTVHSDETMRVLAAYAGDEEWGAAEGKQL
jgi:hypothetical protein